MDRAEWLKSLNIRVDLRLTGFAKRQDGRQRRHWRNPCKRGHIEQAVLSCRVFGLGAETVMGAAATELAIAQPSDGSRHRHGAQFHLPQVL